MSDLQHLVDAHEIANLQGRYLYYVQAHLYERIVDEMFARREAHVSCEISESGVYVGIDKIRALFVDLIKPLFVSAGSLPIHMLTTPVIEVHEDGRRAAGMWQTLGCNAFPTPQGLVATWQQGKYDNRFVKEDGVWKFEQFRWLSNFRTPFDQGWVKQSALPIGALDLDAFPPEVRPSKPGQPYPSYNPQIPMDFGPLPPEPTRRN